MMSELVNKTVREFVEFLSQTSRFPQNPQKKKKKRTSAAKSKPAIWDGKKNFKVERDKLFRKESRGYTRWLLSSWSVRGQLLETYNTQMGFAALLAVVMGPRGNNRSDSLEKKKC